MRSYTFRYRHGQSAPFATLNATDDDHFFKTVRPLWEKETGFKHIDDTVVCATTEYRKVPEPSPQSFTQEEVEAALAITAPGALLRT